SPSSAPHPQAAGSSWHPIQQQARRKGDHDETLEPHPPDRPGRNSARALSSRRRRSRHPTVQAVRDRLPEAGRLGRAQALPAQDENGRSSLSIEGVPRFLPDEPPVDSASDQSNQRAKEERAMSVGKLILRGRLDMWLTNAGRPQNSITVNVSRSWL